VKRYLLRPGPVRSRTDGQLHHVGARELARLYGVPMSECLVSRGDTRGLEFGRLIVLAPRYDGDYRLPEKS
jgi:hypothetical protein